MVTIIVIGAGVVGLSSAVSIQRALPGVKVKVVADRFYDQTTSIGAAGIFIPTTRDIPGVPIELLRRWCETSWSAYSQMATSDLASTTGHTVSHGYFLFRTKMKEIPLYASMVYSFHEMLPEELTRLGVYENFRFGYEITTIITNMRKYMTWLMTQFTANGGEVERRSIRRLSELCGQCDIVVNCSGLGSQQLCGDKLLHPVRGQLIKVKAPWVRDWVFTDTMAQIFPSDDFTVIGGVKDKDNRSMTPDPSVRQGILDRCLRFWPALTGAKVMGDWVGLRPMRVPVRLEKEALRLPEGILNVVHNYGHGFNGVVLSWGTAVEATEMVKDLISKIPPSSTGRMSRICVIGAGVVGLSTGINIQKLLPNVSVQIIADRFEEETTSIGAGGLFRPNAGHTKGHPEDVARKWANETWKFYSAMATSDMSCETGHSVSSGYIFSREEIVNPIYESIVFSCRQMSTSELAGLGITQYKYGYHITTVLTEMRKYMPWLMNKFKENGGKVEKRKIEDLSELYGQYDVVVNCAGLGSRELLGDQEIHPVRGHLIRVIAPWIKQWVFTDDDTYFITNGDSLVLGGVRQKGNFSLQIDQRDRAGILERCYKLWPALQGAKIVDEWVGLRPTRYPLRLERETLNLQQGEMKIVHNYGHGGSGVTLSWGTAVEAAQLVKDTITGTLSAKM
ncbi:uncharacterized protein LOC117338489 [Pecten maximus]|uniref:uncharacterized protein LOC117338489 n=1 Tax=Pecten maximus TaxID=6579 RepID=UPI00145809C1|nr:uncharacterized protein LOC117338489 [Pecten maximus]